MKKFGENERFEQNPLNSVIDHAIDKKTLSNGSMAPPLELQLRKGHINNTHCKIYQEKKQKKWKFTI